MLFCTTIVISKGILEATPVTLSVVVMEVLELALVCETPPTLLLVQMELTCMLVPTGVKELTSPTFPSLTRNPLNALVPVMTKLVFVFVGKVETTLGVSTEPPSVTA